MLHNVMRHPRFTDGAPDREGLLTRVSAECRDLLEHRVLPSSWHDEAFSVEVVNAIVDVLGLDTDDSRRAWFRELQVRGYSKIYKTILPFLSAEMLAKRAPSFWGRQHDTGELIIDAVGDGEGRGRVVGDPHALDPVYGLVITAGVEAALSLTKAKTVTMEHEIAEGELRFLARWTY